MSHNQEPEVSSPSLNDLLEAKNLRTKAVEALERCLEATSRFYDVLNDTFIDVPDHRVRLAAAIAALAYTDGRPIERREIVARHMTTLEDLRAKAKASPELRRAIEELLDEKPVTPKSTTA